MKTILSSIVKVFTIFFLYPSVIISCLNITAQNLSEPVPYESLLQFTDNVLGSDDELYNGVIYYQSNLGSNGHPYYKNDNWQPSSVTINGKLHRGQFAKYNIVTDDLIVILTQKGGSTYPTIISSSFVDQFNLGEHHFVNKKTLNIPDEKMAFLEIIYEGSFSFFASYQKEFLKIYNSKNPHGKYSQTKTNYYIRDAKGVQHMTSVNLLRKYLEIDKKAMKSFLKKNNIKYKYASPGELNQFLQYCDELKSTSIK